MNIEELSPQAYQAMVRQPFSVFDSVAFASLNSRKAEAVSYLVFNDGKNRFGLIAGWKEGMLCAPFSAPYACFSPIASESKIGAYSAIFPTLADYARKKGAQKIRLTLPPSLYDESHIARLYNGLYVAQFRMTGCDVNFHYDLSDFSADYEMTIDPKARQKLRASMKNGLTFEVTQDIESAYAIIKANREAKGYPLWMSLEDVRQTIKVVPATFLLVRDASGWPVASAMVYEVTPEIVQVIYWGNVPDSDELRPMNFLAYHAFAHFKAQGKRLFDIGPSSEYSVPNQGLCDFKQSIGCKTTAKMSFELEGLQA